MDTIRLTEHGASTQDDTFVIFSIDNWNNSGASYKFEKAVNYDDMLYKVKTTKLIGCYKGQLEVSYITTLDHFERLRRYGYFDNQECFLKIIIQGNHMLAYDLTTGKYLGRMEKLPAEKAIQYEGWTYHPEQQSYFVII